MNHACWQAIVVGIVLALECVGGADGIPPGQVLIEFFPTQGKPSCAVAVALIQELRQVGINPSQVVVLDWPNEAAASARLVRKPGGTGQPMPSTLLAGRPLPVAGPALAAVLNQIERDQTRLKLDLKLSGSGPRRTLTVRIMNRTPGEGGQDWRVGLALTSDHGPADQHQVVQRFTERMIHLNGTRPHTFTMPVDLIGAPASHRFRLTAFVQDPGDGTIPQAGSIACPVLPDHQMTHRVRVRLPVDLTASFVPWSETLQALLADPPSCLDCGEAYSPDFLITLPPVRFPGNKPDINAIKLPSC